VVLVVVVLVVVVLVDVVVVGAAEDAGAVLCDARDDPHAEASSATTTSAESLRITR
jgi:hypothetical protein